MSSKKNTNKPANSSTDTSSNDQSSAKKPSRNQAIPQQKVTPESKKVDDKNVKKSVQPSLDNTKKTTKETVKGRSDAQTVNKTAQTTASKSVSAQKVTKKDSAKNSDVKTKTPPHSAMHSTQSTQSKTNQSATTNKYVVTQNTERPNNRPPIKSTERENNDRLSNSNFNNNNSNKNSNDKNSGNNNSSNGLAIVALLAGLGGLGLAGYQYVNPHKTDFLGVEQQISDLTKADEQIKTQLNEVEGEVTEKINTTLNKSIDNKINALSVKVNEVAQNVATQPSANELTNSIKQSLSASVENKVSKEISEKLSQKLSQQLSQKLENTTKQLKSDINSSTENLIEQQIKPFSKELETLRDQVSRLVEAGVADMNVDDLRNAQATISGRVEQAFKDLSEAKTTQFNRLADDIALAANKVKTQVSAEQAKLNKSLERINNVLVSGQRDFALSEVDYLLSMAARKTSIEHSPDTAVKLLKDAKATLTRFNASGTKAFIDEIDQKITALKSVKSVDKSALFDKINQANELVSKLTPKSSAKHEPTPEPTGSITERLTSALKSSVVEIPKDPNAIKITPESAEYARQNVALNLNFIKYAIATDDQALLTSNVTALADNLSVAFADNDALQQLKAVQASLKDVNLSIAYPDLMPLHNSFKLLNQALGGAGESQ